MYFSGSARAKVGYQTTDGFQSLGFINRLKRILDEIFLLFFQYHAYFIANEFAYKVKIALVYVFFHFQAQPSAMIIDL